MNYNNMFLLRRLDANLDSLAPNDKVILLIDGTNASGDYDCDVSGILRNGAVVARQQFEKATVTSGNVDSDADVPGDVAVTTMIIASPGDFIMDGGEG